MFYDKFKNIKNHNAFSIDGRVFTFRTISMDEHLFLQQNINELINDRDLKKILQDLIVEDISDIDNIEMFSYLLKIAARSLSVSFSHDHYLNKKLGEFINNKDSILYKYVLVLILFGYKYSDIKNMSETDIMENAIYEVGLRDENNLLDFLKEDITENSDKSLIDTISAYEERFKKEIKKEQKKQGNDAYNQLLSL